MEFKNLMAEGDFKITSVNLGEDHGTLNMRGKLPGFGDVWVDYTLRFKCVKIRERDVIDFF